jgi:acyl dehydratase
VRALYLEDFEVGEIFTSPGVTLTEAQIIDFALTYDPQPFHTDREAARNSMFGELVASGFQTVALTFRMFYQTGILAACNLGGPGFTDVVFPRPVRPGDTLSARVEVLEWRVSRSKPDRGILRLAYTGLNQLGEEVVSFVIPHTVRRRPVDRV